MQLPKNTDAILLYGDSDSHRVASPASQDIVAAIRYAVHQVNPGKAASGAFVYPASTSPKTYRAVKLAAKLSGYYRQLQDAMWDRKQLCKDPHLGGVRKLASLRLLKLRALFPAAPYLYR